MSAALPPAYLVFVVLSAMPLFWVCTEAVAQDRPRSAAPAHRRTDFYGDPLPPGAVTRFGSARLRHVGCSSILFLPDGKTVVSSAGRDDSIRFWDIATGQEKRRLTFQQRLGFGTGVALRGCVANGKKLVGTGRGLIRYWDVATGRELHALEFPVNGNEPTVGVAAVSPDGTRLALVGTRLAGTEKVLYLWDAASGKELHAMRGHKYPISGVAFSPDGRFLASGDRPEGIPGREDPLATLCVWEVATGRILRHFNGEKGAVNNLVFLDGDTLVASNGGRPVLFDWRTEAAKPALEGTVPRSRWDAWIAASPNGKVIAGGPGSGAQPSVQLWEVATGRKLRAISEWENGQFAFSRDGRWLGTADIQTGLIRVWDVANERLVSPPPPGHTDDITAVALSPDCKTVATASRDGTVRLWEAATGRELRVLRVHSGFVLSVAFSPDGRLVALGGGNNVLNEETQSKVISRDPVDNAVRLWEVATGREVRILPGGNRPAHSVTFSSDGRLLAAVCGERARLWDLAAGTDGVTLSEVKETVVAIAFSPDGKTLVAAGYDTDRAAPQRRPHSPVRLWDTATLKVRDRIQWEDPRSSSAVAYSPDGYWVAIARPGDGVRIWDLSTAKEWRPFSARAGELLHPYRHFQKCALAYSADNHLLAVSAGEGPHVVKVYEAITGQVVLRLHHEGEVVDSLAFGSDSTKLLTVSNDRLVYLWNLLSTDRPAPYRPPGSPRASPGPAGWWADLAHPSSEVAFAAVGQICAAPAEATRFLRDKFQMMPLADTKRVQRLIGELDNADFATREAAHRELDALGSLAVPELRRALQRAPSPELRRRAHSLLEARQQEAHEPQQMRLRRALQALEYMRTPEALQVLEQVARGDAQAPLTEDAKAALNRLNRRAK
jgi:WD40 repeat protein